MKPARNIRIVLVTTPDLPSARRIAKAALQARLAACANIVPRLESHYWWQGRLERSGEVLMILKTTRARLLALEAMIIRNHPYDTPEVISFPLETGNTRYIEWLVNSVKRVAGGQHARVRSKP
jgi:periplasmic divalent cation tolerance protein